MKINLNILFIGMGVLILGMILWNVYLLRSNSEIKKEKYELERRYQDLEGFKDVLKYDLTTSRDSVRILEKELKVLSKKDSTNQ